MKHRSVIAFVIVAAALFAAPQLSHDLQTLRSVLGSRLSGELMQAFLSLSSTEGADAAVAPLRAETQFTICTKGRPAAKQRKNDSAPAPRAEVRAAETADNQLAMIEEPLPVSEPWSAALPGGALIGAAELPHKSLDEVAMIIPPDSGIDPRVAANVSMAQARRWAQDVRVTFNATRFEGKSIEWRKADESLRKLEEKLPGTYEFRLDREGSKTKVLKVKRGTVTCCPLPAPPAPRSVGVDAAAAAPLAAVAMPAAFVSE